MHFVKASLNKNIHSDADKVPRRFYRRACAFLNCKAHVMSHLQKSTKTEHQGMKNNREWNEPGMHKWIRKSVRYLEK